MKLKGTSFVQRLWSLCNVLRDDGITYHQYVEELALLLFLKMAKETGAEARLPKGARWDDLLQTAATAQLPFYRALLSRLAEAAEPRVRAIFAGATTSLRGAHHLATLTAAVDALAFTDTDTDAGCGSSEAWEGHAEGLGELYEGLLQKNASELKSGAGQYFTPRPLVESIVRLLQPRPGERIHDPAAGTGGFLVYADRYLKESQPDRSTGSDADGRPPAFLGVELVPSTRRLALMNLTLHGVAGDVLLGDTLSPLGAQLGSADVIFSNPPFGNKRGGGSLARPDLHIATRNKQLLFLQHCYRALNPGGRAAVIVPDNVLFEEHAGNAIRTELLQAYDLHTILRLPTGIFYAPGVKTNVLFFTRPRGPVRGEITQRVWIYDLRTGCPPFGKRSPLTREHLRDFEQAFGADPAGGSPRVDGGPRGRFRCFTRQEIRDRGDSLDLTWLPGAGAAAGDGSARTPHRLTTEILGRLRAATGELEALCAALPK